MIMIRVSASEFSKNFGRYREVVQREPIAVTSHNRVTGYFIPSADYEAYLRIKAQFPHAMAIDELSDPLIEALSTSAMDARHAHLDSLLDD
jgi:PHD/YefM family antitoxin component YafN of YafNO toxin-antitoxin module